MRNIEMIDKETLKPSRLIYFTFPYILIILLSLKTEYFRYAAFGLVVVFVTAFLVSNREMWIKRKYLLLAGFLIAYFLIGVLSGSPIQSVKNTSMFIVNLAPFFIFDWVFSSARLHQRKQNALFLLKVITPVLIYTVFATLYYLFKNPYIARYMANFDPSRGIAEGMEIMIELPIAIGGGYTLIYGVILLPPVFLFLARSNHEKCCLRIFSLVTALFLLYFIIKSGFATAFIVAMIGCILSLLLFRTQKLFSKLIILCSAILVYIILSSKQLLITVIREITSVLPMNSIIAIRLNEIPQTIYGSSSGSSFSNRIHTVEKTWSAFVEHPLLGVGYTVGYDYYSVEKLTGLHTEWLDILAQYGLFLGVPFLLFIAITLYELIQLFRNTSMEQIVKLIVFMIVFVGFLNPIQSTSIFIIALLFIPSLLIVVLSKETELNQQQYY